MFELVFLGTSASAPAPRRNLPALVVKHDEYRFLVDCGEGTQRQILQAGIGFKRLNNILIDQQTCRSTDQDCSAFAWAGVAQGSGKDH